MNKNVYPALWSRLGALGLIVCALAPLGAQNLPLEMRISADGRRLTLGAQPVAGFYDESVIRNVEFNFAQPNYWTLMTANYQSQTEIPATVTVDGVAYDSVGVRFKGQTSYGQVQGQKKSFALSSDTYKSGQKILGYDAFNFNNCFLDPSFLREVLYLHLSRNHIPSAKANWIKLKINGQDWGIYGNVQNLSGDYLTEWFMSDNGTRWRGERSTTGTPGGPGGPNFGAGTSSLNWLGSADTTLYKPHYTLKKTHKDNPWSDLVRSIDKLYNTPAAVLEDTLKHYMDVDRTLWFLAHEILFTDDDSYVWKGGMDYYLYWEAETGRLTPLEYDGNTCMDVLFASQWSPFYRQTDTKYALMNKLFPVPALRQRYVAHVRTILEEDFQQPVIDSLIDAYYAFISPEVQADPKKLYTFTQFQNEKQELKTFFANRRNFVMNNPEIAALPPTIGAVDFTAPSAGQPGYVTASASVVSGIFAVRLYYATGYVGAFERTEMYDDGTHYDGAAGDGVYGGIIPAFPALTPVRFYVEAVANNNYKTVAYAPKGAEHDVFFYQVQASTVGDVVINEFLADNDSLIADPNGQYEDWIELYNRGNEAADLSGWFLSDSLGRPAKWQFPAGTVLPAGGYLIVWADEDQNQPGLHASFKLAASGEAVLLTRPDTTIADQYVYGDQTENVASARVPNGTGPFVPQAPTFAFNNDLVKTGEPALPALRIFPNPTSGRITVETDAAGEQRLFVFDATGQKLRDQSLVQRAEVDLSGLPGGVYLVQVGKAVRRVVVK